MKNQAVKLYDSMENSFLVDDWPWGYTLRTEKRFWVESRKGHGMRFCSQTKNPKTGKWCKPKKSIYNVVLALYLDENGHLKTDGLSAGGWSKEERIKEFEEFHKEYLNEFQRGQIKYIRATNIMNKVITYEIKLSEPVSLTKLMEGDPEERAEADRIAKGQHTKEEQQAILNKAFAYGMAKVEGKIK